MAMVAALIGFLFPLAHRPLLLDGDTYWHLAAGRWILAQRAIPHTDVFSSTMPGAPWVAHEWLSEVLMALAFDAGGWSGLTLLCGAALAATLGLTTHYLQRRLAQPASLVCATLVAASIVPSLFARPHVLALVPLSAWCVALLTARDAGRAPSWRWLALMVLWANLHGSFVLGLALAGLLALEAVLGTPAPRAPALRQWGWFLLGAAAAAMCTPFGWRSLWHPFQLMQPELTSTIAEWQPPNFNHLQPLTLALMTLLYTALSRPLRIPTTRVIMLLGLLYMALKHSRHQMVAGLVGALLLAAPLGLALGRPGAPPARPRGMSAWGAALLAMALLAAGLRLAMPQQRGDDPATPMAALDHVPPALRAQPVFNSYEFGGYLIYRQVRPFVDGRADMYGSDFIQAYLAAFRPDRAVFERASERYDVRWALIAADSLPMLYLLDTLPHWRRLYADEVAVVYVRER
ncbi:hypothetical protein [Rugamonas apoptosis]|uniref:Glycosyltransferase RgtA/B/C/D-like domain-containing protein n=1 Tax=Rugamonas apoptosis TaxID=2758570 RepID=A0A7W2IJF1_9BURK|nr:hypothetical protein [Rugamonas apoptosis]MBA5686206.1 hypothetical protein [Rugamonas apoptosis]